MKTIGKTTYALSGWVWKTHLQKPIKESGFVHDVHIMHQSGLFMGGPGALEEPALWIVDCRWRSSAAEEKAWDIQDYGRAFKTIGRWMKEYP